MNLEAVTQSEVSYKEKNKYCILVCVYIHIYIYIYIYIYITPRKMVLMNLLEGKEWRCRYKEWTCGHNRRREWDRWRK